MASTPEAGLLTYRSSRHRLAFPFLRNSGLPRRTLAVYSGGTVRDSHPLPSSLALGRAPQGAFTVTHTLDLVNDSHPMLWWNMNLNPYASFLNGQDPLQVIASTPAKLESLAAAFGPKGISERPAPGKWSAREVLCHLADTEITFAFRLRQTLAQPLHVIQPFEQDDWAKRYQAYDAQAALAVFAAVRGWNIALIRSVPSSERSKPVTHPERGDMTFQTLLETMAGHDLSHICQIEAIPR